MADLRIYRCNNCNEEFHVTESIDVFLMSGRYAQCACKTCKSIVDVQVNPTDNPHNLDLTCPFCKKPVSLWTPDKECPKCGGTLKKIPGRILAD